MKRVVAVAQLLVAVVLVVCSLPAQAADCSAQIDAYAYCIKQQLQNENYKIDFKREISFRTDGKIVEAASKLCMKIKDFFDKKYDTTTDTTDSGTTDSTDYGTSDTTDYSTEYGSSDTTDYSTDTTDYGSTDTTDSGSTDSSTDYGSTDSSTDYGSTDSSTDYGTSDTTDSGSSDATDYTDATTGASDFVAPADDWVVGMKLEAKDRLNPTMIAVATITAVDDETVSITFDNWDSSFDYTADKSDSDLHPIGYAMYTNQPQTMYKPRDYPGSFNWKKYLRKTNSVPVPYESFNMAQTEGMPIEFYIQQIIGDQMQPGS